MKKSENEIRLEEIHSGLTLNWQLFNNITKVSFFKVNICMDNFVKLAQKGMLLFRDVSFVSVDVSLDQRKLMAPFVANLKLLKILDIHDCSFKTFETIPLLEDAITNHLSLRKFSMTRNDCCPHIGNYLALLIKNNKVLSDLTFHFVSNPQCEDLLFYQFLSDAVKSNWRLLRVHLGEKKYLSITQRNYDQRQNAIKSVVFFILSQKNSNKKSKLPRDIVLIISRIVVSSCSQPELWYKPSIFKRMIYSFV